MPYVESVTYVASQSDVAVAVGTAIADLGWKQPTTTTDPTGLRVATSTRVTFWSWGESIEALIAPLPGGTRLDVTVKLKFGLVAWGLRKRRAADLLSAVGRALEQRPTVAPAGWYPDPEGSPRQRWWDGSAWGPFAT